MAGTYHTTPHKYKDCAVQRGVTCVSQSCHNLCLLRTAKRSCGAQTWIKAWRRSIFKVNDMMQTYICGYGAGLRTEDGKIEERSSKQKSSCTHKRISTRSSFPQVPTHCYTHCYTQHSSYTCDDAKIQTGESRQREVASKIHDDITV